MITDRTVLDTLLIVTKVLGSLFAGAFGILGLLTDYRDKRTHAITKWGRRVLFGIVISTIVAVASQAIETVLNKIDAKDANTRLARQVEVSNATLREVERSIFPLKDLTISYAVEIPVESPLVRSYRQKVATGIQKTRTLNGSTRDKFASAVGGGPDFVDYRLGPELLPRGSDGMIYSILQEHGLNVSLFRAPFDADTFFQQGPTRRRQSDLSFVIEPQRVSQV